MPLTPFEVQLLRIGDEMETLEELIKENARLVKERDELKAQLAKEIAEHAETNRIIADFCVWDDHTQTLVTAGEALNKLFELRAVIRDIANLLPERSRLGKDAANFVIEDVGRRARFALGKGE